MAKQQQVIARIHLPETDDGRNRLQSLLAAGWHDAIIAKINSLDITYDARCELYQTVLTDIRNGATAEQVLPELTIMESYHERNRK